MLHTDISILLKSVLHSLTELAWLWTHLVYLSLIVCSSW